MLISLQILRAIAVILVIIVHFSVLAQKNIPALEIRPFYLGLAGVDIFFVISGFIMYYIISKSGIDKYEFIRHRFFRIYPLYWFYFAILLSLALYSPHLVSSYHEANLLTSFFLLPSFSPVFLNVSWTLVYEIYFYFIVFVFLVLFKNVKYFLPFVTLTFATTFLLSFLTGAPEKNAIFLVYGSPLLFEFVMGSFIFYTIRKYPSLSYKYAIYMLLSSITLFITVHLYYEPLDSYFTSELFNGYIQYGRVIYYGIPATLFVYSILQFESVLKRSRHLNVRVLTYLGNASYSLYLSHYFILVFLFKFIDKLSIHVDSLSELVITLFVFTLLTLAIGSLLYELIEKRVLKIFGLRK